jgi:hypothetical protein
MADSFRDAIDQNDAFVSVNFSKMNFDDFSVAGLHFAADKGCFDGQFAMAAVDQDAEANSLGAAEIEEAVHRGADGSPGVKDIVYDHEVAVVDRERYFVGVHDGLRAHGGKIVAIERDVDGADGNLDARKTLDGLRQSLR